MESHKDVIVSQPPAMYSQSSYTQNISLENYKGILLCDRPTALSVGVSDVGGDGARGFVTGGHTGNPVGLGPSAESRDLRKQHEQLRAQNARNQKNKSAQVLSRHRRWLRSFAQQMKQMQQADVDREVAAAQRAARLRDAELQKRREMDAAQSVPQHAASAPPEPYNMHRELDPFKNSATKKKSKAAASKKPKWAMTEDEALDAELGLNDDLLDFAKQLDYDKFINDYAVAEALGVMRDRVAQIAAANDWSEADILRAAEPAVGADDDEDDLRSVTESEMAAGGGVVRSAQPAHRVAFKDAAAGEKAGMRSGEGGVLHEQEWDATTRRGLLLKRAISQDALALAERMLTNSPSLQKIYTKHSLARVLQRCALTGDVNVTEAALAARAEGPKGQAATAGAFQSTSALAAASGGARALPAIGHTGTAIQEPRLARIAADATVADGAASAQEGQYQGRVLRDMQNSKERTQGLPYLYRCPAI